MLFEHHRDLFYSVVYHNADGAKRGLDGPGLAKMPDGALVAVVPAKLQEGWHCQVVQSTDRGHSWQPVGKLPYHSAVPWEYQGVLYLFTHPLGTRFRNDDLLLLRSDDAGKTWSELVTLFEGHFWNCQTGMVIHDNRL
ncbi:hypothetical protein ES703_102242 [subsurface metagenome]